MSQFFVIASENKPSTQTPEIDIQEKDGLDEFIKNTIQYFGPLSVEKKFFLITDSVQHTSDFLFTEAQNEKKFSSTRLFSVITEMYTAGASLYFWYGSDFTDLTAYKNIIELLGDLDTAVHSGSCEFYGKIEIK